MYGLRRQNVHPPGIAQMKIMPRRNRSDRRLDLRHQSLITRNPRQIALRVRQIATRFGNERPRIVCCVGWLCHSITGHDRPVAALAARVAQISKLGESIRSILGAEKSA